MRHRLLIIATILLIFNILNQKVFCQNRINLPNVASIYNPSTTIIHPKFKLFHKNEINSSLYSYLNLSEYNAIRLSNNTYEIKIQFKIILYRSIEKTDLIDSFSNTITLNKTNLKEAVIIEQDIVIPVDSCFLIIITKDVYNSQKNLKIINVDKTKKSKQNFILVDADKNNVIFNDYINPFKDYKIKFRYSSDSFLLKKYLLDTSIASPPFSSLITKFKPNIDSLYVIRPNDNIKVFTNGIYQVIDYATNCSFSFTNFGYEFPGFFSSDKMIPPLIYISNTTELKELNTKSNKKLAIDDFWLTLNSNLQKVKILIKIYYNRLFISNYFFSTYKEGWATDRGLIYTIFGPPPVLHRTDNYEEWIYIDTFTGSKVSFIFDKKYNEFSDNVYILRRNYTYNSFWRLAMESWRNGEIYIF
jgi:GWxTD domain-containing protein